MTEEIKNGIDNGVKSVDGGNGVEAKDGVEKAASDSNVDEIAKLRAELAKRDATISKFAEEKKQKELEAEQVRVASLSTEEQLKELKAKLDAQEEERQFNNAFASNGLNAAEYRKALELFKNKDFNGLASFIAGVNNETATRASEKSVNEFKEKIQTSTAPDVKDNTASPFMASMRKAAGLN